MQFASPWMFLLLLAIPVVVWWSGRGRRSGAILFSTTAGAAQAGRSLRQRMAFLPLALRASALILLTVALARPQKGMERVRDINKGIAIEMIVDRSGSMGAEMTFRGQRMNRLEVVKKVFEEFVMGNADELEGRPNDLIGMISFARYADTVCPLTLAHGALPRFLESVKLVEGDRNPEQGTALGDGLALAAARLKTAEEALKRQAPDREDNYEIKSKIAILLTDGDDNASKRKPIEAAKLAADWGIKVYTIAVGSDEAVQAQQNIFGAFLTRGMRPQIDTEVLEQIAQETGGRFFLAKDAEAIDRIYREIDELERSEIESIRFVDYKELFLPFALAAILLLTIEQALMNTVFRKIP
jgi:Ca-activated chloride channel family protein